MPSHIVIKLHLKSSYVRKHPDVATELHAHHKTYLFSFHGDDFDEKVTCGKVFCSGRILLFYFSREIPVTKYVFRFRIVSFLDLDKFPGGNKSFIELKREREIARNTLGEIVQGGVCVVKQCRNERSLDNPKSSNS